MKNTQVVVVEGYHDQIKVNQVFPDLPVIITNGSEISKETLSLIYQTSLTNEVILFLDPDYPGKQITHKILSTGGHFSFAYIPKEYALSKNKKKVGIEHASKQMIYQALKDKVSMDQNHQAIGLQDLIVRGLANKKGSALLRKKVVKELNIPYSNAKTFLKYINMLKISLERIDEIL